MAMMVLAARYGPAMYGRAMYGRGGNDGKSRF